VPRRGFWGCHKTYDKVSAIVEVSLPLAAYFDIPQNGAKTDFFKQNHQLL